jgi:hypothetical protein
MESYHSIKGYRNNTWQAHAHNNCQLKPSARVSNMRHTPHPLPHLDKVLACLLQGDEGGGLSKINVVDTVDAWWLCRYNEYIISTKGWRDSTSSIWGPTSGYDVFVSDGKAHEHGHCIK